MTTFTPTVRIALDVTVDTETYQQNIGPTEREEMTAILTHHAERLLTKFLTREGVHAGVMPARVGNVMPIRAFAVAEQVTI